MHTVRLAAVADASELARMQRDFNDEFDSPSPSHAVLTKRYERLLADPDGFAVLAAQTVFTGFATVTLRPTVYCDGPLAVLDELYVSPPLRGQSIGTRLLTAAIDEVRRRGGGEMHINVDEVDTDARRFYERHGFVNVEPGTDYRMLCYLREPDKR